MSWAKYKRLSSSKDLSIFRRGTTAFDGGGGGAANDPDAQAYIDALGTAGYTVSGAEETAINNHFLDLKGAGPNNSTYDWWTGIVRLLPFIGTNAAQQGIEGQNPASAVNFYGGMTFSSIGAEGNGTNAYFDFFAPNEIPDGLDVSIWAYETKNLAPTNYIQYYMWRGSLSAGGVTEIFQMVIQFIQSRISAYHGNSFWLLTTPDGSLVPASTGGLYGTTRYQSNGFDAYAKGIKYTQPNGPAVQYSVNANMVPGLAAKTASGSGTTVSSFSSTAFGYALITTGISTQTEADTLKACIEAFMTALNREV